MITQKEAADNFIYDYNTGILYHKTDKTCGKGRVICKKGSVAGCEPKTAKTKHKRVHIKGKQYNYHHIVWLMHYGHLPIYEIDHIDGDPTNNKINNLKDVTHRKNQMNQKRNANNSSGLRGVTYDKSRGKWRAQININGVTKNLGRFDDKYDAFNAYKKNAQKYGYTERHINANPT